ncbi:hypothetical protein HDU76_013038 [Blyttiomyces sp. JEL0837]|nr:hypothetical protein HDU76_013038 [Blyttiomyces sp. JEL0837]
MNMFDSIKVDWFTTDNLFLHNPKYYEKIEKVMNGSLLQIAMRQCWMEEIRKFRETVLGELDTLGQYKALANLSIYFGHLNLLKHIESSFRQKFTYELTDPATVGRYLCLAAVKQDDSKLFDQAVNLHRFHWEDWESLALALATKRRLVSVMLRISSLEHADVFVENLSRLSPKAIEGSMEFVAQRGYVSLFKYLYPRVYKDRQGAHGWIKCMSDYIMKGLESMNADTDTNITAKAVSFWHAHGGAAKHSCHASWVVRIATDKTKLHIVEALKKLCRPVPE